MDLDVYQPCPCGSGKKLKFCCCKDMLPELDQVIRMLEGEQRLAGMDRIKTLIEKKGPRDALLSLSTAGYLELGEYDRARTANKAFLASQPNNPIALAQSATLAIAAGQINDALDRVQSALESVGEEMPFELYETILITAQVLLSMGNLFGGRALLMLHASLGGERDTRAFILIGRINQLPNTSLLLRQYWPLAPASSAPVDAFEEAAKAAARGMFRKALAAFSQIAEQAPDDPAVWRNIALLQLCMGQEEEGRATLHKLAAMPSLNHDDAVEAEALAQLLDSSAGEGGVDNVTITYKLSDVDGLLERLASDKRLVRIAVDSHSYAEQEEVPPKAAFGLLDRVTPEATEGLSRHDIPVAYGQILIFGRQTDREARLEFTVLRFNDFDQRTALLAEVVGSHLGEIEGEEVVETLPLGEVALTWQWRFPERMEASVRRRLIEEQREHVILEVLPHLSFPSLQGKSLLEAAAGDVRERIAAEAGVLTFELNGGEQSWEFDFARLREKLGMPATEIHPAEVEDIRRLPLVRWSRIVREELGDDQLVQLYHQAVFGHAVQAARLLAEEILRRGEIEGLDKSKIHLSVARMMTDPHEALGHIYKAREIMAARGESPAMTLLEELTLRLATANIEGVEQIVQRLQTNHMNEPGVAEALYQIVNAYMPRDPSGSPAGPSPQRSVPPGVQQLAGASDVWTPSSQAAPPTEEPAPQKSKLWLPGMD